MFRKGECQREDRNGFINHWGITVEKASFTSPKSKHSNFSLSGESSKTVKESPEKGGGRKWKKKKETKRGPRQSSNWTQTGVFSLLVIKIHLF